MLTSQSNFLIRIKVLKGTLDSTFLRDNRIGQTAHNEKARILRNGISIIAFSILEDFIKERTGEAFDSISNSNIQFSSLSPKIQSAATLTALGSILEKAKILKRTNQNWIAFIQNETNKIASTAGSPFSLSRFSIGRNKSNLNQQDVSEILALFNITGGWQTVQQLTTLANSTLISPETFFTNAAERRHTAAHDPNANCLYSDLIDYIRDVKSFSFAFDALISKGLSHIVSRNTSNVTSASFNLRFLIKDTALWKEFNSTYNRSLRSDSNYQRILSKVRARATLRQEFLVVKSNSVEIMEWFIP